MDHHGSPIPARLLPLHPEPWHITTEEATAMLKARGDYVAGRGMTNWLSEVYRGYQFRPADQRKRIDDTIQAATNPTYALQRRLEAAETENKELRARLAQLEGDHA